MQLRRAFGTIHLGHLVEERSLEEYLDSLFTRISEHGDYTAAAFALEEGTKTKRKHIQLYVEHSRKRPSTLAKDFGVKTGACFDVVRDAAGSWAYCTGTGPHRDKPAIARCFFGVPKLHGDTQRADLKLLVQAILDGITPEELARTYPYAWCVHRARLIPFYRDWDRIGRGLDLQI